MNNKKISILKIWIKSIFISFITITFFSYFSSKVVFISNYINLLLFTFYSILLGVILKLEDDVLNIKDRLNKLKV